MYLFFSKEKIVWRLLVSRENDNFSLFSRTLRRDQPKIPIKTYFLEYSVNRNIKKCHGTRMQTRDKKKQLSRIRFSCTYNDSIFVNINGDLICCLQLYEMLYHSLSKESLTTSWHRNWTVFKLMILFKIFTANFLMLIIFSSFLNQHFVSSRCPSSGEMCIECYYVKDRRLKCIISVEEMLTSTQRPWWWTLLGCLNFDSRMKERNPKNKQHKIYCGVDVFFYMSLFRLVILFLLVRS